MEDELLKIAREFLVKVSGELDPHTSIKGKIESSGDKITLLTPSHIQFAKYGRGPGSPPPLEPMLKWVKREGIIFEGKDYEGTANSIRWGISKNGTIGFTQNAPNAVGEAVSKWIDEYNRKVGFIFTVKIKKEIDILFGNTTSAGTFATFTKIKL